MKKLKLKKYQRKAVAFLLKKKKVNLFADPGMGKTLTVLFTLHCAHMMGYDVYPAIVVAPLKVGNSVWEEEARNFPLFNNMRFSKILGDAESRSAAVKKKADVYIINYENIDWLAQGLGKDGWKFRTVVCDESTRIKNHRVSSRILKDGKLKLYRMGKKSVNAERIVVNCTHHLLNFWINLSGTPTPRGLFDLWGQQFPIDQGKALGRSFNAHAKRWFMQRWGSRPEHQSYDELPHAEEEILSKIKKNTLWLHADDWFDLKKPILIDRKITLPKKIAEQYYELHKEAVTELKNGVEIEDSSAGNKCRQFASGNVLDSEGVVHKIHSAKLDSLENLVDELDGAPLLVAYQFKADRDAILKRFPKAVLLPKGGKKLTEVQNRWNKGKIPMLVLHPQSAGHGLNLQHGGHHICIYTPDWNAEYYEQVLARIGPVRQMQSGYNRFVYIYRLIARGTWDELVIQNLETKMSRSKGIKISKGLKPF